MQAFDALRAVHAAGVVHGDVTAANMVWDPSGHFFQFIDLEFATWPLDGAAAAAAPTVPRGAAAEDCGDDAPATRVVSPALAIAALPLPLAAHTPPAERSAGTCRAAPPGDVPPPPRAHAPYAVHGSTPAVRMAPHGTYEFGAFSPLKGCWPCAADDVIGLFWSVARSHCHAALWWGGLNFSALLCDEARGVRVDLTPNDEADLIAFAQARARLGNPPHPCTRTAWLQSRAQAPCQMP